MEKVREYRHVDLVGTEEKATKLAAQPIFRILDIFHDNLFAVERYKSCVEMNTPIYTGVALLELWKLLMYEFHYDYINKSIQERRSSSSISTHCYTGLKVMISIKA